VNIINITYSAFAVLLLSSSMAAAETQYPASDFQPKVVYQDPEYKHAQSSPSASPNQAGSASASDSKYPAANFQPKVVYNDPSYKHTSSTPAAPSAAQKSVEGTANVGEAAKKEESGSNYLIGLIVLALVGVVLFRKKSPGVRESSAGSSYRVASGSAGGLTGVAKYINRKAGTGVSRYLEQHAKSASSAALTGVAKYMAKQSESESASESKAATGVEKYMRNRG
jgi:hypothetical protein